MNATQQTAVDDLRRAIEVLYSTFGHYGLRPHVEGCPCCVSVAQENQLHSKRLRELTPPELEGFSFKAMSTWGQVEDFKHFLPRLFEIQSFGPGWLTDSEVLFGKLDYARWRTWPAEEQSAISDFLRAFWSYSLSTTEGISSIEERLCSVAQTGADMVPFLSAWMKNLTPMAADQLAGLIYDNAYQLTTRQKLGNEFWSGHEAEMKQVTDWLFHPATGEAFENFFMNSNDANSSSAAMESARMFFAGVKAATE